jgi:probable blue pigment (indigoidine) exporter
MNRTVLLTATAPLVWGTTYVVTTELLPPGRPLLAATVRALPAGLLLLAITRRLPRGHWWWRSLVLGTLNIGAFFVLLFISAYRLPGGVAAVLGAAQPLLVAGLSVLLLAQRPARRTVVAGVLGAAGVAMAVLTAEARLDPVGIAAGLAGTASMGLGIVLAKRWGQPEGLLTMTAWQLTAGGVVLLPVAAVVEGPPPALTAPNAAGLAYLSLVGCALAYTVWFRGIERLPAASVSLLALLSPVVATLLGRVLLDQGLTPLQMLGICVALAAVLHGQPPAPAGSGRPHRSACGTTGGNEVDSDRARTAATERAGGPPPAVASIAARRPCPLQVDGSSLVASTQARLSQTLSPAAAAVRAADDHRLDVGTVGRTSAAAA